MATPEPQYRYLHPNRALAGLDAYRGETGYHLAELVDGRLVLTPLATEGNHAAR